MRRGLVAVLVPMLAVLCLAGGCGSDGRAPSVAERVPALAAALDRVDAALAAHHFDAARQRLRGLKAAVVRARESGDLDRADAQRVLDAVARLMATLPTEGPQPTVTSSPTAASTTPSGPSSKHPQNTATAEPTQSSTTAAPAPSSTPTPTPSPSPSPVAVTSPAAAATSGP